MAQFERVLHDSAWYEIQNVSFQVDLSTVETGTTAVYCPQMASAANPSGLVGTLVRRPGRFYSPELKRSYSTVRGALLALHCHLMPTACRKAIKSPVERLIFLDLDGVLNSTDWYERRGPRPPEHNLLRHNVDPVAIERLNRLCTATRARIVFSSSWRYEYTVEELNREFKRLECCARVIGKTPRLQDQQRGHEIQAWLNKNRPESVPFVILDDDADMAHLLPHLVQTSAYTGGLTDADVDRAIEMLMGK